MDMKFSVLHPLGAPHAPARGSRKPSLIARTDTVEPGQELAAAADAIMCLSICWYSTPRLRACLTAETQSTPRTPLRRETPAGLN